MTGKDERGRFSQGNAFASIGGRARAERLTPEQRRAIARAGFRAMVAKRFNGDTSAAVRAIAQAGNGVDAIYYGHSSR